MGKPKTTKTATPAPLPIKSIKCRLPRNYEWNGNGYNIR